MYLGTFLRQKLRFNLDFHIKSAWIRFISMINIYPIQRPSNSYFLFRKKCLDSEINERDFYNSTSVAVLTTLVFFIFFFYGHHFCTRLHIYRNKFITKRI